ncbi:MAG: hypothetical protein IJD99_02170 [Clostridia bacterium]|nr:hypothetical protein [Clostridia bacterium]
MSTSSPAAAGASPQGEAFGKEPSMINFRAITEDNFDAIIRMKSWI